MNTDPIVTTRLTCPDCSQTFWRPISAQYPLCGYCYSEQRRTDRAWFRGELALEIVCALILALAVTVTTKALWFAVPIWAVLAWAARETWRELKKLT